MVVNTNTGNQHMEASICGEAATTSSQRAWYDNGTAASTSVASTSADGLDAYFKAGSNATTAAYFSQMQAGAYPGMSYHGKDRYTSEIRVILGYFLQKVVMSKNVIFPDGRQFYATF